MKTAYIIITEKISIDVLQEMEKQGYINTFTEISPETIKYTAILSKLAAARLQQLPAYQDGWRGEYYTAIEYADNCKSLYRYLKE